MSGQMIRFTSIIMKATNIFLKYKEMEISCLITVRTLGSWLIGQLNYWLNVIFKKSIDIIIRIGKHLGW